MPFDGTVHRDVRRVVWISFLTALPVLWSNRGVVAFRGPDSQDRRPVRHGSQLFGHPRNGARLEVSRRESLTKAAEVVLAGASIGGSTLMVESNLPPRAAWALETDPNKEERRVYKLNSGIQFRDLRVGNGPSVTDISGDGNGTNNTKPTVVMHVQALLRDGTILMDTRQDGTGRPILYELGSALNTLGGSPGVVTPGMDDAIVSRGTLVGTAGERVAPMRQGGIRLVVVPADLAYGNGGVSRYQAWKSGGGILRKPVPRDEVLRYEIEILRCMNVAVELPNKNQESTTQRAQACCPEELYPCQGPDN